MNVVQWLNTHHHLYISTITKAEILYGIYLLDDGKRKNELIQMSGEIFNLFAGRILPFCEKSANHYANIIIERQKQGKPILMADALIASIALANDLVIVTRNVKDFEGITNLVIVNPF